ncbi:MAG TPA: FHA domain-containing protein [Planctomycetota bacterium]|nr:FHA domain-containing protein [Planctomycetota bacterium]
MASVTVIFGGKEEKTYTLDKSRLVVGREPKCDIQIDNLGISREHCAFSQRGEAYLIQDLNSSNGTYVNGKKITEHFLNNDDEIIIGKYKLLFKNEQQQPAKEQKEGSVPVPDTLNTYVMDGPKIQQQLEKMRSGKAPIDANAPKQPVGATARDYAKALDAATDTPPKKAGGGMKIVIILLVLMFLFLLFVAGALAVAHFVLKWF